MERTDAVRAIGAAVTRTLIRQARAIGTDEYWAWVTAEERLMSTLLRRYGITRLY